MLYYLKGKDSKKILDKAHAVARALLSKKPNSSVFNLSEENWSESLFSELLESQGLFEKRYIVFADRLFSNFGEFLEDRIKEIKDSENVFLIIESLLSKKIDEKLTKYADKIDEVKSGKKDFKAEIFNIFSLTEALASRDKKKLWVLYNKARIGGIEAEEILPTLFWQIKTLLSVKLSKNPESLGLKPFVLGKARRACQKWQDEELQNLLSKFVSIYHETRLGLIDFDTELEKTILEM